MEFHKIETHIIGESFGEYVGIGRIVVVTLEIVRNENVPIRYAKR